MARILMVDDEADIRLLVRTRLENAGYAVIEAASGQEALEKALAEKPDLIITDAMMPVMDGFSLARDLRQNPATRATPIIMLTALHTEQDELKAFQEGVDDFITKPFSISVLRARVEAMLSRYQPAAPEPAAALPEVPAGERAPFGLAALDAALSGGLPRGNNFLLVGPTGAGKSTLARRFVAGGLAGAECSMVIALDDEPMMLRQALNSLLPQPVETYEQGGSFSLVDAYSWSRGSISSPEKFAVSGILELNQLAGVVSDASAEIGQSVNARRGGRRLLDSMSSLFINFDLALVQRFLAQLARTAVSYGGVTSLFVLEEGSVTDQVLNNIKYIVDGVIETKIEGQQVMARVGNMKWSKFSRDWVTIEAE